MTVRKITNVNQLPEDMLEGIYIVSDIQGYDVEIVSFFQLLKVGRKQAKKMRVPNLLKLNHIGEDGLKVDFSKGALLRVQARNTPQGLGFRFANAEPMDERGWLQWAWAKSILGIVRVDSKPTDDILLIDGQFRVKGSKDIN